MALSDAARERYAGQLRAHGWSEAAQERLAAASATVVDAGPLGCAVAAHLAAAGVGRLGIVDGAAVGPRDLHGAPVHFAPDVGRSRADSAAAKLGLLNPDVEAQAYPVPIEAADAGAILAGTDAVTVCAPEHQVRALVNDAACANGLPLVTAGFTELGGWVLACRPGQSACSACAFPDGAEIDPPVPGVLVAATAAVQALEALRLLTGSTAPRLGQILEIAAHDLSSAAQPVARRPECPACGDGATPPQSA